MPPILTTAAASAVPPASDDLSPRPFHLGYRRALDGLRGVSILAVMSVHAGFNNRGGFIGVEIFFVLSGFLISCLLIEEWDQSKRISLKGFYARRALRLLPALMVMLAVVSGYHWLYNSKSIAWSVTRDGLIALFYSTNWVRSLGFSGASLFGHAWSLSIEEQFYVIWPLILILLLRRASSRTSMLCWVLLGIVLSCLCRVVLDVTLADWNRLYFGTDSRAGTLLTGCAAGIIVSSGMMPRSNVARNVLKYAALLSAALLGYLNFYNLTPFPTELHVMFLLVPLSAAVVIMQAALSDTGVLHWILSQGWLVYVGRISYGLYLWHLPIFLLTQARGYPLMKTLTIELSLSVAATLASFYFLEQPILRIKRRYRKVCD